MGKLWEFVPVRWVQLGQVANTYDDGMSLANYQRLTRLIHRHGPLKKIGLAIVGDCVHDQPALSAALRRAEDDGNNLR
jgi:hypothetical protein